MIFTSQFTEGKNKPEHTRRMPPPVDDAAETLATLQDRLKQLEDQLLQLNVGGQPEATGASTSSTGSHPTIRVSVPSEKRFRKCSGARHDQILDD